MAITLTTPAASDGSWLSLRPPAPGDVEALEAMLDDPVIRTAMRWPDRDHGRSKIIDVSPRIAKSRFMARPAR